MKLDAHEVFDIDGHWIRRRSDVLGRDVVPVDGRVLLEALPEWVIHVHGDLRDRRLAR